MGDTPLEASQDSSPGWRMRQLLGLSIVLAGVAVLAHAGWQAVHTTPEVRAALRGGSIAALATALGVLPMLLSRAPSARTHDTFLGFGAGVMLAACCFSLLIPALDAAQALGRGPWGAALTAGAGLLIGAGLIMVIERLLPHEHFFGGPGTAGTRRVRRLWLFVFAIVLHNLPEGLAIGAAAAGTDPARAMALATGIAIQDVPEGLVVALALHGVGIGRWRAAAIGAASGLVEPVAAVFGASVIAYSAPLLPWGLACAAGSMLFVVSHEVIPSRTARGTSATRPSGCCSASC